MIFFILSVLGVAFILYILLAGADFGAGILQLFKGQRKILEQEKLIGKAMGPVWEANHIWLILIVVILFVGFPRVYTQLSTFLHIPLSFFLVGIVARGCAFTFKHYDAIQDRSQKVYSWIFSTSSLWTSFWFGMIAGSLILGDFRPISTESHFLDVYVFPWLNVFCLSLGIFTCALFCMLASTFLIAEAQEAEVKKIFAKRYKISLLVAIVIGGFIFMQGFIYQIKSLIFFFTLPTSLLFFILGTLSLALTYFFLTHHKYSWLKYMSVIQVSFIFGGWVNAQFPYLYQHRNMGDMKLNILQAAAPDPTLKALMIGLIIGLILIIPPYIYLMYVFKKEAIQK
ncbi:MAG: cytochrome d ubiquinol oxidase subunit 2 [Halobacteriovoraceae bacterium]|nr:cytochrome d ubiquinol oxidase subunit 2 [Halobacteriovoraceae bacterium]|tara:strand:+ start:22010 stop:23032 length:1023 start_codon:yes stop_codon:yes gene_type:complete